MNTSTAIRLKALKEEALGVLHVIRSIENDGVNIDSYAHCREAKDRTITPWNNLLSLEVEIAHFNVAVMELAAFGDVNNPRILTFMKEKQQKDGLIDFNSEVSPL